MYPEQQNMAESKSPNEELISKLATIPVRTLVRGDFEDIDIDRGSLNDAIANSLIDSGSAELVAKNPALFKPTEQTMIRLIEEGQGGNLYDQLCTMSYGNPPYVHEDQEGPDSYLNDPAYNINIESWNAPPLGEDLFLALWNRNPDAVADIAHAFWPFKGLGQRAANVMLQFINPDGAELMGRTMDSFLDGALSLGTLERLYERGVIVEGYQIEKFQDANIERIQPILLNLIAANRIPVDSVNKLIQSGLLTENSINRNERMKHYLNSVKEVYSFRDDKFKSEMAAELREELRVLGVVVRKVATKP